jgi:aryl-alcohol dehydrogenase-like predicted oxidoreductase
VANPSLETSWLVLAEAAKIAKVPLWNLEPEKPWQPPERIVTPPSPITLTLNAAPHMLPLGPEKLLVSRVGVSGHYGLPVEGYQRAAELGVNFYFWEPNYDTLTEFSRRLPPHDRSKLQFVAGTFEAEPKKIRRNVEQALRRLNIDRLGLFLVFWVQTWGRITDEVRAELAAMKAEGKMTMYGLSTHNRPLAIEAMREGWNPVMVRHSAAHRGAESTKIFDHATEFGTSLLTFNNTCYGRLLQPYRHHPAPNPADCYRYTLEQKNVVACWTAPSTLEQLEMNLTALSEPHLPDDRRESLVKLGDDLYREETMFRRLVRML